MKRIIHTPTLTTTWRGPAYIVDGRPGVVDSPDLVLAAEVVAERPEYDSATHKLVRIENELIGNEYHMGRSEVVPLTQAELDELAEQTAQQAEEDQARQVYQALRDGTGTQAERLRRVELVCAAIIRRLFGR
jgi:hypothetical protein